MVSLFAMARRLGVPSLLRSNPPLYRFLRDIVGRLDWFLPLEPDFWAFQQLPVRDDLFLDIGANDGISARSFRKVNPATPILSLEPNACHRPALERLKATLPGFDYRIVAAGDTPGAARLYTPVHRGRPLTSFASLSPQDADARLAAMLGLGCSRSDVTLAESTVDVVTVDSMELPVAYAKIDVEGHELSVLRGMRRTLARCRPIVMVEYFPPQWPSLLGCLGEMGYDAMVFEYEARRFEPMAYQQPDNVFLFPRELRSRARTPL